MNKVKVSRSVAESAKQLKNSLQAKGFIIFCDIDHQKNAKGIDIDMPASRCLIFGNPAAGTKLMQKDIAMSLDLPLRIAIVDINGQTNIIHHTTKDYCNNYEIEGHPVLEKIETLFSTLISEL